jgi:hypothetical protein
MRYSLLSRFRGTLQGAVLSVEDECCLDWSLTQKSAKSLIALGRFDLDDWLSLNLLPQNENSLTKAIFATLPIILLSHENEIKLRQNLADVAVNTPIRDGILAIGYAIALALREQLDFRTLLSQTIAFVGSSPTAEKLLQVQTLIDQSAGLAKVITELGDDDPGRIAIALYCFLTTREDFYLTVSRTTQIRYISPLAGALSGAYNSTVGIPVNYRIKPVTKNTGNPLGWKKPTGAEIFFLADALLAIWSGVYQKAGEQVELPQELSAIASPRIIRLRSFN